MKLFSRRSAPVALALTVGLVVGTAGLGNAGGTGTPANKVVASGSHLTEVAPGQAVELLRATMKTSKPTDLILQVAAECEIYTEHLRQGKTTYNKAAGRVQIWVEVDGQIVPIQSFSQPPQNTPAAGTEADKATFCEREEEYRKADNNSACVETADPLAPTNCEFEEWFQRTKNANAFNWVRLNVGSGTHSIVVRADLETATSTTPPEPGSVVSPGEASGARAAVGNRTLVVEPTKMANDAVISESGTG